LRSPAKIPAAHFILEVFANREDQLSTARNKAEADRLILILEDLYRFGSDAAAARILACMLEVEALEGSSMAASKVNERFLDMTQPSSNVDVAALLASIVEDKRTSKHTTRRSASNSKTRKGKGSGPAFKPADKKSE
jgi:hypothetical protein